MAGKGDKVVFSRMAERLRASIPGSVLRIIGGAGHMVHHSAPQQVVEAIRAVSGMATGEVPRASSVPPLHSVGEPAKAA